MQPDHKFMLVAMLMVSLIWFILALPRLRPRMHKVYFTVRSWWWMLWVLFAAYLGGELTTALFFVLLGLRGVYELGRIWHPKGKERLLKKLVSRHICLPEVATQPALNTQTLPFCFKVIDWILLICLLLCIGSALLLNHQLTISQQRATLFFVLFCSQFSDVAQYLCGKVLGGRLFLRPKFINAISPNKTIEGALFGTLLSSLTGGWLGYWLTPYSLELCIGLAYLIAWLGITGDLLESMFKRSHGIKDTGTMLTGHGGVLDRIDSLLLSIPAFTLIYWLL